MPKEQAPRRSTRRTTLSTILSPPRTRASRHRGDYITNGTESQNLSSTRVSVAGSASELPTGAGKQNTKAILVRRHPPLVMTSLMFLGGFFTDTGTLVRGTADGQVRGRRVV